MKNVKIKKGICFKEESQPLVWIMVDAQNGFLSAWLD
jgi:hypothetical protein